MTSVHKAWAKQIASHIDDIHGEVAGMEGGRIKMIDDVLLLDAMC
jgi:hypothetical protein